MKRFRLVHSRCRAVQNQWINRVKKIGLKNAIDLGGAVGAEYQRILGLTPEKVSIWNLAEVPGVNVIVNLDQVDSLPSIPKGVDAIILMNVLEHLYSPLELLKWVCTQMPVGATVYVVTPFIYPFHPSPNDYWRMTPQVYERFFKDLEKFSHVKGELSIEALGEDYREAFSLITTQLIHQTEWGKYFSYVLEHGIRLISKLLMGMGFQNSIQRFGKDHCTAVGVRFYRTE